ncbi:MAG: L-threonylcarbamoyladenylate synthase [Spirosomataceae bacterium]
MADIGTDILYAKQLLQSGQVVGIPTETVYGLAGNAFDEDAVLKIFNVKNRPQFDPLIIHTDTLLKVATFVSAFPEKAQKLAIAFWPGPLTLLLPKSEFISDLVTSGLDTVAVRIPNHPLTLQLLSILDFPLAAPSANPFGYISPTSAQHVAQQLGEQIPYILEGGKSNIGLESTIVGFEENETVIYRLGGIAVEVIEEVVGPVKVMAHSSSNPKAPGMLKSHYAPLKPLFTSDFEQLLEQYPKEKIGYLAFQYKRKGISSKNQRVLSSTGDAQEAAKQFFSHLRYLDNLLIEVIYAEFLPEEGLGRAINDRIRRATVRE